MTNQDANINDEQINTENHLLLPLGDMGFKKV